MVLLADEDSEHAAERRAFRIELRLHRVEGSIADFHWLADRQRRVLQVYLKPGKWVDVSKQKIELREVLRDALESTEAGWGAGDGVPVRTAVPFDELRAVGDDEAVFRHRTTPLAEREPEPIRLLHPKLQPVHRAPATAQPRIRRLRLQNHALSERVQRPVSRKAGVNHRLDLGID